MTFSSTVKLDIPLVKRRILELDLKKTWIAAKIGVTKSAFFDWLNGKVKRVKYANAKALAEVLELSLDDITAERNLPDQPQALEISEFGRRKSSLSSIRAFIELYFNESRTGTSAVDDIASGSRASSTRHSVIHLISVGEYLHALDLITEEANNLPEVPPSADIHLVTGHLYYLAQEYAKALRSYNRTFISDKSHPSIVLRVGYLKGLLGYFDEARHFLNLYEPLLESATIKDLIIGDILFEQGLYDKSLNLLAPILDSLLSQEDTASSSQAILAGLIQARSYLVSTQVKKFYEQMARIPIDAEDNHTYAFYLYLRGLESMVAGRSTDTMRYLTDVLSRENHRDGLVDIKTSAKTRMLISWMHFHAKEHKQAMKYSVDAGDLLKKHFKPHHFLQFEVEQVRIETLLAGRKMAEAKRRFEFFEQVGHNCFSHDHVKKSLTSMVEGKIHQAEHKFTDAIACYDAAMSHIQHETQRQYIYGFVIQAHKAECLAHLGRYEEAEALYKKILPNPRKDKTFSLYQTYFVAYAGMLAKKGDTKSSLTLARTVYRRHICDGYGDTTEIYLHYGKLWLNSGNPKKAMVFFKKAALNGGKTYQTQTIPFYIGLCLMFQRSFDDAKFHFEQVERNLGKPQNIEPRLFLNISYMTGLIDTYRKAPQEALRRFDHILESRYREQFDAVCFHHAYVYFFMGINNFLLDDRIDSQFYLKRFVHAGTRDSQLLPSDVQFSKYLLSNLEANDKISVEDCSLQNPCLKGYIHLDKALV